MKANLNESKLEQLQEVSMRVLYTVIKGLVHITVLCVSALLTISMFRSFSSVPLYKTLWSILAIAIEGGKVYLWVLAIALILRNEGKDRIVASAILVVYLGLAVVSFTSNSGFGLQSIQAQSFTAEVRNQATSTVLIDREIDQLDKSIELLQIQINTAINKKANIRADWSTEKQDNIIAEATLKIEENNNRINELLLQKQASLSEATSQGNEAQESKASDIFSLLGGDKYEGDEVMLLLMRLIAILLESLTIITAGKYPLKSKSNKNTTSNIYQNTNTVLSNNTVLNEEAQEDTKDPTPLPQPKVKENLNKGAFITYIKALYSEGKEKLVNDIRISEMTGLKLSHCKSYRRRLQGMEYNGSSLIISKKGVGTSSIYALRSVLKLIEADYERQWK